MMSMRNAWFIGLSVMFSSLPAFADVPPGGSLSVKTEEHQNPPSVRRWYGDQTLIVDGASIALGITGSLIAMWSPLGGSKSTDVNGNCTGSRCPSHATAIRSAMLTASVLGDGVTS